MIRWVKESLSTAERAVGDGRWVVHLQGLVSEYNSRVIPGTDVVRKDVNENNYVTLLEKKYKSDSWDHAVWLSQPETCPGIGSA